MKKLIILFCLLIIKIQAQDKQDWITIFIHGSVGLRANINLGTFRRLVRDCVAGSLYEKNVASIRENPFLFTMQPMQECGLKPIRKQKSIPSGSYAFASIYNYMLKKYRDPRSRNKFYTFGWSGLVSNKQRYKEARILYKQLKQELERLSKKNINPKIRIVAYSHGATLSYNLATLRETEFLYDKFCIDEMISIGTPVFTTTKSLISHPIFKNVYHFYSEGDNVQRLDLFSGSSIISSRFYHDPIPKKLKQIEIKITEFICPKLEYNMPFWKKRCVDYSPGHVELWFFGWAKRGYSQSYLLNPLPTAIFIPYLQKLADTNQLLSNSLTIDLRPRNQQVYITKKYCLEGICIPFISEKEFTTLKDKALKFHPCQPEYLNVYMTLEKNFNCNLYK